MAVIRIKTPEQIEGIRRSCELAAKTLDYVGQLTAPGVTLAFLNDSAEEFMRDYGAVPAPLNYKGFPKATCISLNEEICHGIPAGQVTKEGDIAKIDITTILDGYYGDVCRTFAIGAVSQEALDLIACTKHCLELGIEQVRPDNHIGNIGWAINNYARSCGYSVVYQFCGHGVGIEFHELPQIPHVASKNSGAVMKPGMIFTIEPMINAGKAEAVVDQENKWTARTIDGRLSAQFEHTILVTPSGAEVLTL